MALVLATLIPQTPFDLPETNELACDIVELRLDALSVGDVTTAIETIDKPVLCSCRRKQDGGVVELTEEDRKARLSIAVDVGCDLIDVDHDAEFRDGLTARARSKGIPVIVSHHDLTGTQPAPLLVSTLADMGEADVVKLATLVERPQDVEALFEAAAEAPTLGRPFAVMGIKDASVRANAGPLGMALVYAAPGKVSVPGQLPARLQARLPMSAGAPGQDQVFVLMGDPGRHSLSPIMHHAAFRRLGVQATYVALDVPQATFEAAIAGAAAQGLAGGNATTPHKTALAEACGSLTPQAEAAGAANTFRVHDGELSGHMTDGLGAADALTAAGETVKGRTTLVLGAGPTAAAIAHALTERGAELTVSNRTAERAGPLARDVGAEVVAWSTEGIGAALPSGSLLINATPADPPVDVATLAQITTFDCSYAPGTGELTQRARIAGAHVLDGLDLLVHQGVHGLGFWLERELPTEVQRAMRCAVRTEALARRFRGAP